MSQQNYAESVKSIFSLLDKIKQFVNSNRNLTNIDDRAAIDLFKHNTYQYLTDLITNLSKNYDRLFAFCFELRKQDLNNNYTFDLLNG